MKNINLLGKYKDESQQIHVKVNTISFIEDSIYFIHCPQLDITGYGNSEEDAKKSFQITLGEFLNYAIQKNTLDKELKRLGWKKIKKKYIPPYFDEIITSNNNLANLVREKNFHKSDEEIAIPA